MSYCDLPTFLSSAPAAALLLYRNIFIKFKGKQLFLEDVLLAPSVAQEEPNLIEGDAQLREIADQTEKTEGKCCLRGSSHLSSMVLAFCVLLIHLLQSTHEGQQNFPCKIGVIELLHQGISLKSAIPKRGSALPN